MDLAGLPDEPDAGTRSERRSTGARGPAARAARSGTARSERLFVGQAAATPEPIPAAVDSSAAETADQTADRHQAEYFLGLLIQRRRLIDRRIDEHRKGVTAAEAGGDAERAYGHRRMAHSEEQERRTLDAMIEKLHRRFFRQGPGNISPGAQVRFAAR